MSVRGAIYYKPDFRFHDGGKSDKLILLLNTPARTDDYLFVPTTSKQKIRSRTIGCVKHYGAGEFFIPTETTALEGDTWIILAELYPLPFKTIQTDPGYARLRQIDKLVYKLYDLTDEEIEIVEAASG